MPVSRVPHCLPLDISRGFLRTLLLALRRGVPQGYHYPTILFFRISLPHIFVFVYHLFSILIVLEYLPFCKVFETNDRRLKRFWSHLDRSRRSLFLDHGRGVVKKFVRVVSRDSFFAMMLLTHIRDPFSSKCRPACPEFLHLKNFNLNIPTIPCFPSLFPCCNSAIHRLMLFIIIIHDISSSLFSHPTHLASSLIFNRPSAPPKSTP